MVKLWLKPVNGIVTSLPGARINPVLGKEEIHEGMDIACKIGTKVIAIKDGTVTEVGNSTTYGKYLKYKTTDDYTIMYAHLSKIYVKEGKKIKAGKVICKSGDTGLTTGPHLHYGVYFEGELFDQSQISGY